MTGEARRNASWRREAIVLAIIDDFRKRGHEVVNIEESREILNILLYLYEEAGRNTEGIQRHDFGGTSNELDKFSMFFVHAAVIEALVSRHENGSYFIRDYMKRYAQHYIEQLPLEEQDFLKATVGEAHDLHLEYGSAHRAIEALKEARTTKPTGSAT